MHVKLPRDGDAKGAPWCDKGVRRIRLSLLWSLLGDREFCRDRHLVDLSPRIPRKLTLYAHELPTTAAVGLRVSSSRSNSLEQRWTAVNLDGWSTCE